MCGAFLNECLYSCAVAYVITSAASMRYASYHLSPHHHFSVRAQMHNCLYMHIKYMYAFFFFYVNYAEQLGNQIVTTKKGRRVHAVMGIVFTCCYMGVSRL